MTDYGWARLASTGSGLEQHRQQWCPVADREAFCTLVLGFHGFKRLWGPCERPCCSCRGDKVNQHNVAARCPNLFAQGLRHWGVLRACRGSLMSLWQRSISISFASQCWVMIWLCSQGCYPVRVCTVLVFCQGLPRKGHGFSSRTLLSVGPY